MRVDLNSLGTFNRIGRAGATEAAESLSMLTGLDTFVESTGIHFSQVSDVETLLQSGQTRVAIEFEGALEGRALMVFDRASADYVLSHLQGTGPEPDPAYLNEVANIATSSFVDGWAENYDDVIDISTPDVLEEDDGLVPAGQDVGGSSFVFHSVIQLEEGHHCEFFLVPEPTSFLDRLQQQVDSKGNLAVGLDELTAFLRLTVAGAETVAEQLETLTGMDTTVRVSHLDLVPIETLPQSLDETTYLGTVFRFEGPMDGYLAVLFEEDAAAEVVEAMVPGAADTDSLRQSAIEELGNITASGFVDGWANAIETTIDHTVPDFVEDMGRALLESIAVQLGQHQEVAYVFDVTVTAGEPMQCRVFAFPEEAGLQRVIASLDGDIDVSSVERL